MEFHGERLATPKRKKISHAQVFDLHAEVTRLTAENERLEEANAKLRKRHSSDRLDEIQMFCKMTLEVLESFMDIVKAKTELAETRIVPGLKRLIESSAAGNLASFYAATPRNVNELTGQHRRHSQLVFTSPLEEKLKHKEGDVADGLSLPCSSGRALKTKKEQRNEVDALGPIEEADEEERHFSDQPLIQRVDQKGKGKVVTYGNIKRKKLDGSPKVNMTPLACASRDPFGEAVVGSNRIFQPENCPESGDDVSQKSGGSAYGSPSSSTTPSRELRKSIASDKENKGSSENQSRIKETENRGNSAKIASRKPRLKAADSTEEDGSYEFFNPSITGRIVPLQSLSPNIPRSRNGSLSKIMSIVDSGEKKAAEEPRVDEGLDDVAGEQDI
ncbi:hypothetical protein HK104_000202 [Borealophlyctis nickersoniae]|nr:hypothetical protein HK104_000202 [Borealophlyctis nickersoniae]